MKITVVFTSLHVPFAEVVTSIQQFDTEAEAVTAINEASAAWWAENEGDRCRAEMPDTDPYEPITELGYDNTYIQLWGGESHFNAMLEKATYDALHKAHYKREFDDKGKQRPGYLLNIYEAQGTITPEQKAYRDEQLVKLRVYGEPQGNA